MIASHLPERFRESIERWILEGIPPGRFLEAVLANDLKESFARADDVSVVELPGLVSWLYNHAPMNCWGSREIMDSWREMKRTS